MALARVVTFEGVDSDRVQQLKSQIESGERPDNLPATEMLLLHDAGSDKAVVIGTEATVSSHAYRKALSALQVEAREKACPLLVPLVEEGWVDHAVTEEVTRIYLGEAFADGFGSADVLLLGCTHYPLLKPMLQRVVPGHVTLVDSAESTALAVQNALCSGEDARPCKSISQERSSLKFFVTDSAEKFKRLGALFLGQKIDNITHVELKE